MEDVGGPELVQGQDLTYTSGEVTMRYTRTAPEPPAVADTLVLLVHGIGMGRLVFADMAPILSALGEVIAPDLPGFGDSPEPGSVTGIEQTARNLAEFIDTRAPRRVVLVGHSMGTQIVTQLAADRPELVAGLVLIAPTINRHERTARMQAWRMVQDLAGEGAKVLFLGLLEYVKTSPLWFVNKLRLMLAHRLEDVCPRVSIPVLVLRGETDKVSPRDWTREVARAFPRGRVGEIPGRGHEAIIKSPQPVASMILAYATEL